MQQLCLQTEYQKNPNSLIHIRCITALAFFKTKLSQKKNNGYKDLFKHVEQTWIGYMSAQNEYVSDRFSLDVWNMYQLTLRGPPRINNATEGWHNALRSFYRASHPQIYKIIDRIQKEQPLQEVTMAQVLSGHPPTKGLKKYDSLSKGCRENLSRYRSIPSQGVLGGNPRKYLHAIVNHLIIISTYQLHNLFSFSFSNSFSYSFSFSNSFSYVHKLHSHIHITHILYYLLRK